MGVALPPPVVVATPLPLTAAQPMTGSAAGGAVVVGRVVDCHGIHRPGLAEHRDGLAIPRGPGLIPAAAACDHTHHAQKRAPAVHGALTKTVRERASSSSGCGEMGHG